MIVTSLTVLLQVTLLGVIVSEGVCTWEFWTDEGERETGEGGKLSPFVYHEVGGRLATFWNTVNCQLFHIYRLKSCLLMIPLLPWKQSLFLIIPE